ncbi:DUF2716 domain-containing protein [Streptosporangium sp. NPDC002721]|uniref:DUF2716 domain-containing protein n=1 Tax=Streptosporangium sp. NPDC002721 TaxID=3366188 RepID=UPI003688D4BB
MTTGDIKVLLALHDTQLRGRAPAFPPTGAVVEQDGPLTRIHYGTHGSVDHLHLPATGLDELIARQLRIFTARGERVEWKVYAHDTPADLPARLRAAGFTQGWERTVLIASLEPVAPMSGLREMHATLELERVTRTSAEAGPQHTSFADFLANGELFSLGAEVLVLDSDTPIDAVAWAYTAYDTNFMVIGGIVDPELELAPRLPAWNWRRDGRPAWRRRPDVRYLLAEADGALRAALERAGFQAVTTTTTYHWTPPTRPAANRPVKELFKDPEYDALWNRLDEELGFRPSTTTFPGIAEPSPSVTWSLKAFRASQESDEKLQGIIERGLLACVPSGEVLYWLDWQHIGYRFDPGRVGRAGQPLWPGDVHPNGDYYFYLTADLRMGTFGHPWERTLCVFGTELLARVERPLTALLGTAIRSNGQKLGDT